jgi:glutamate N-acetyltransferase / amino-acid N-acetyltransferase
LNLPLGYRYATTYAGIRAAERDDLSLIVSGMPATAAAVFTQNRVQASPVRLSRRHPDQCRQCQLRHAYGRCRGARHM